MNRIIFSVLAVSVLTVVSALAQAPAQAPNTFAIGGGELIAAENGSLSVPAVRSTSAKDGRLTLRYVRFKSRAATPGPPIVFLAGGPGDAATRAFHGMPRRVLDSLTAISDVIAFDQRGTGTSDPSRVTCPPLSRGTIVTPLVTPLVPLDAPLDPVELAAAMRAQLAACLTELDAAPFTTTESADDLQALAGALGAKQILLLAGSYGTHLALAAARQHPETIAGMALLGVEGPDDTLKLPSRVEGVLAEIDRAYPGVRLKVSTLADRLRRSPSTKTLPNGQNVTVGVWDLQRRIAESLSTTRDIAAMMAALDPMMTGDYSDLVRWTIPFRSARPMNLMHVATDCASFASAARLASIRSERATTVLGDAINFPMPEICDTPGLPRLPDGFRSPLISAVPALLVAGTFDGRTPPPNVTDAAKGLSKAQTLFIPRASHGLFQEPAAMSAVVDFFTRLK